MSTASGSPDPGAGLRVRDLRVSYRGVPAVRGVDLDVGAGEAVGLIGPNGAGKTSTMLAVMGVVRASGEVSVDGRAILGQAPERIVRHGVALVPEGRQIFGGLSVRDNLRLGGVGRRERAGYDEDLAWVRALFPILDEFADRQAGLLSGGQQQQLAIARALMSRPRVLLLDEPSLGLSPAAVDIVFDALREICRRGTAVLVVEQRAEFTVEFCDRTHVLHEGLLTLRLGRQDAHDADLLTRAYFGS